MNQYEGDWYRTNTYAKEKSHYYPHGQNSLCGVHSGLKAYKDETDKCQHCKKKLARIPDSIKTK